MSTVDKCFFSFVGGMLLTGITIMLAIELSHLDNHRIEQVVADVTPLHKVQEPLRCTSPFDIYITYEYELVDDNKTLITAYGRVYNLEDCRKVK